MEATLQSPFGQTVLEPGVVTIGSTPDSRVVLHDVKVSPHHAVVRSTEQGYTITDWGSSEGTFVNNGRLEPFVPHLLTAGDQIRIGETVLTYEAHEGSALVAGQGSSLEDKPTVLAAPPGHTASGAGTQPPSALLAHAPSQQPDVPMDMKVEPEPLSGEVASPGEPITHHCPQCNAELPEGAHFCGKCGFSGVNEAGPGEEASTNQVSALIPAPSQQPDVLLGASEGIPAYEAPPLQLPSAPPVQPKQPPSKGRQWKMPRRWRLLALIALLILVIGGSMPFFVPWLHSVLPAARATVTITPVSQQMYQVYDIAAVKGTPDPSQHQVPLQMRLISYTTPESSLQVAATGQGTEGVTEATGTLTFSQSTGNFTIYAQTFSDNSGIGLTIDSSFNLSPGQTVTMFAHASVPGTVGNVPVDDINGTFNGTAGGTIYIENTSPFTGGTDRSYSVVQQSDIDDATNTLVTQLTSDAQAPMQQQLHTNEAFADNGMQCTPHTKANHQANDRASDVTVTVSLTCKAEAYDVQAARSMATDWFKSDATSQLGTHYALVGDMVIGTPQVLTPDVHGTVTIVFVAQGTWTYQFSETQKQQLAQLIAGKPLADARALLLKQAGVKKIGIITAGGWGSALPTSPNDIKFNVLTVQGLQATS